MPTFSQRGTGSIADSVRSLLSSSPKLTASDVIAVETAKSKLAHDAASTNAQNSLAEKHRLEADALRERQRFQSDPQNATDYAATSSGLTREIANQINQNFRGESLQPTTAVDDNGEAMPLAKIQLPPLDPAKLTNYRTALASTMATRLATGNTNAQQMAQAGQNLQENANRESLANPDLSVAVRQAAGDAVSGKFNPRYTLSHDASTVFDPASGSTEDAQTEMGLLIRQLAENKAKTETARAGELGTRSTYNRAHAGESGAHAGLYEDQAADVRAGKPRVGAPFKPADPTLQAKRVEGIAKDRFKAAMEEYNGFPLAQRKKLPKPSVDTIRNQVKAELASGRPGGGNAAPAGGVKFLGFE